MTDIVERLLLLAAVDNCQASLEAADTIIALRAEVERFQRSFDLRWDASMRAIKRWQEAHPGNDLNWPDHADLVVWLLERDAALRAENERLRAYALKAYTVVEFCSGEGFLLKEPHYDCDDLLMEGVELLKVETSKEARAALEGPHDHEEFPSRE